MYVAKRGKERKRKRKKKKESGEIMPIRAFERCLYTLDELLYFNEKRVRDGLECPRLSWWLSMPAANKLSSERTSEPTILRSTTLPFLAANSD